MNQPSRQKSAKDIGWIVLLLSVICVLATYIPYSISIHRSDEGGKYILPFGFALTGVLPAGIVFCLDEFFLKKTIGFQKTRLSNQLAIAWGLTVGITLVLITLYLIWTYTNLSGYYVPFLEFLFLSKSAAFIFFNFDLRLNPFITPIIINIVSSPYMGWRINNARAVEVTLVVKE